MDPTPKQISELILLLDKNYPEEARLLSLAVLQAPSYKYLDYIDRECPLTLFHTRQMGKIPDFFQSWRSLLSKPMGDRFIEFLGKVHSGEILVEGIGEWKIETILNAECSPSRKSTIGESYELAKQYLLWNKYNNYNPIFRRWIMELEHLFITICSVPREYIDQFRRALKVEFGNSDLRHYSRVRVSRGHKSEYSIDQVTAAIILLEFAEKMHLYPYDNKFLEGLLSLWTALSLNRNGFLPRVNPSQIRNLNKFSPIVESLKDMDNKIMDLEGGDVGLWSLITMYQRSTNSKKLFPNLTNAILKNQIRIALKKCGVPMLGGISENAFKSFPHLFRSLRIPHVDLYRMRAHSTNCNQEKMGRLLLSFLEMPCIDLIRSMHVSEIQKKGSKFLSECMYFPLRIMVN